ncbi:hypothetical protein DIC66_13920 [Rhodoferax lacus]|uniref:OmpH family outer membrane protein n=1 Tax=Rhodoferax lacus TaxID=2184758 RepID=A0A3E1RAM7_9BURK|nr:OmpH family outer membrane protein [Rhodoferax lacus]RFO96397.1 hypothetical protein DIC66_13920 [Rhodoferax lacus]
MKRIGHLIVSILCLLGAATQARAVPADLPTATSINARKILSDSKVAKDALAKFQADFLPQEAELRTMSSALKEKSADLDKVGPTLNPSQLTARQKEIDDLARDLKRRSQQFAEDRDARKRDDIQHVFSIATQAVKKLAESSQMHIVFQDTVYTAPGVDITAKVIQIMDAQ